MEVFWGEVGGRRERSDASGFSWAPPCDPRRFPGGQNGQERIEKMGMFDEIRAINISHKNFD